MSTNTKSKSIIGRWIILLYILLLVKLAVTLEFKPAITSFISCRYNLYC